MEDLKPIRRYRYRWRVTLSCGHSRIWHLNERPVDVQGLCAECPGEVIEDHLRTVTGAEDLWHLT